MAVRAHGASDGMTVAAHEQIPLNQSSAQGSELAFVQAAVEEGHTSADGPFSKQACAVLREEIAASAVLLTTSCTSALEMAAMLLTIQPGDTVVVPSFGFVTTALAFAREGARIAFCDIENRTLGLDPQHLACVMDDTVRAVVPIHYAGVACDVDGIGSVLDHWPRAELVEDNAHGLFGEYRGQQLGSFGRFAALSFHETKSFTCGEGGALVINSDTDVARAHVLYNKGTDRRAFLNGEVDKYTWQDVGSSFGLSDILAAFLCGQLEQRERILAKRQRIFDRYYEMLAPSSASHGYALPYVPADSRPAYHAFYVLLPDAVTRDRVLRSMQGRGVRAAFHFVPLHESRGGRRFRSHETDCPVSRDVSSRLLRMPFYNDLSAGQAERVVDAFLSGLASCH